MLPLTSAEGDKRFRGRRDASHFRRFRQPGEHPFDVANSSDEALAKRLQRAGVQDASRFVEQPDREVPFGLQREQYMQRVDASIDRL